MGVPGNADLLLLKTAAAAGGYQVSRSLRFNSADSAYLSRTPASAGNRKTFTLSFWIKHSNHTRNNVALGALPVLSVGTAPSGARMFIGFADNQASPSSPDCLRIGFNPTGSSWSTIDSANLFRDFSAWQHFVVSVDCTQATASNRVKAYVNGAEITFSGPYPGNTDQAINDTVGHAIGRYNPETGDYLNAYLADIWFLDGIAATPGDFAETDATTGQWIPKAYTGSKGTNGFHLEFADNSNNTATTLGKDTSGNSPANNWTPNNFTANATVYRFGSITAGTNLGSIAQVFDNSTLTKGNGIKLNTGALLTYTFPFSISYTSSVEIWGYINSHPSGGIGYAGLGTSDPTSGGTGISSTTGAWFTIASGSGSFNAISIKNVNELIGYHAVRVDGVRLVDGVPSNIDVLVDTPTSYGTDTGAGGEVRGNYCTLNPLANGGTLSNGNLDATSGTDKIIYSTFALDSGKYYWEITLNASNLQQIGIADVTKTNTTNSAPGDSGRNGYIYLTNGSTYNNGTLLGSGLGSSTTGDVIGVAYDGSSNKLWLRKNNGSWFGGGDPAAGTSPTMTTSTSYTYTPVLGAGGGTDAVNASCNWGQRSWAYSAPSGYKALCDTNLTSPVVAKPSTVMDVALYTGTGSSNARTVGFSPDFVWVKPRSNANPHQLFDRVRGDNARLKSNATDSEYTYSAGVGLSFDSSGFTVGTDNGLNESGQTFVAWTWDAGTSTVTNTQGSITSQVRANASAGFSIVTWTGSAGATIGHGLGVAPQLIIAKSRTVGVNWEVYHASLGKDKTIELNNANAAATVSNYWGSSAPTSTVFGTRNSSGDYNNTGDMVAYCFAPVAGYSSALSWTGNGSSDGPLLHCGFSPRFFIAKRTDAANDWWMWDTARSNTGNPVDEWLSPNRSDAEYGNDADFDFLSNGIKIRTTSATVNASGGTYIGFAWASNPFQYARAQ